MNLKSTHNANNGCLGDFGRGRTQTAAILVGKVPSTFDPTVSEWSNPTVALNGGANATYFLDVDTGANDHRPPPLSNNSESLATPMPLSCAMGTRIIATFVGQRARHHGVVFVILTGRDGSLGAVHGEGGSADKSTLRDGVLVEGGTLPW